jgi:hypothetical protein
MLGSELRLAAQIEKITGVAQVGVHINEKATEDCLLAPLDGVPLADVDITALDE